MNIAQPARFRHLAEALTQRLTGRTPHQHKQARATGRLAVRSNLKAGACENPGFCFEFDPATLDMICRVDPNSAWCRDRD